jgi:hypothetical protein
MINALLITVLFAILWIRIGSDPHLLPDSDRYRYWYPEYADPDLYKFQANEKSNKLAVKIMTPLTLMKKMKNCKLAAL